MNLKAKHIAPLGFTSNGIHAGIKASTTALDLAMIRSEVPATVGATFTTSSLAAAPVIIGKEILKRGKASAIIVNSGNANSCTGDQGIKDAREIASAAAKELGISEKQMIPSSTGLIGECLPVKKIIKAIPPLAGSLTPDGFHQAARAIMTTDTFPKLASREINLGKGKTANILGIAKGAGMIAPNMATMLSFICTDAQIDSSTLKKMTQAVVRETFNRISVDGDMSTNDSVFVLANGMSGASVKTAREMGEFLWELREVMTSLANMIIADAEGSTKSVEIIVCGAKTEEEADTAARAIGESLLVKTALHGADPNWGRIAAALGQSGVNLNQKKLAIKLGGVPAVSGGVQVKGFSEAKARKAISGKEITIEVDLGTGKNNSRFLTCDLSKKYVEINAHYRS